MGYSNIFSLDFDFNAITDENNEWVQRYSQINIGLRDPKFHFFPSFDTKWLSWFPQRAKVHKELDIFLSMLDDVIAKKREAIKQGLTNDALEENERDLLGLMIEAEERGEGIMDNEELKVHLYDNARIWQVVSMYTNFFICSSRVICVSFSWLVRIKSY